MSCNPIIYTACILHLIMHEAKFIQCHNPHLTKHNYSCAFVLSFKLGTCTGYVADKTEQNIHG